PGAFSFSNSNATQLTRKMPGCAFSVFVNSASGPLKQIGVKSYPRTVLARSNHCFADGNLSAKSFPMPTTCAPCPANNNAVLLMSPVTKHERQRGEKLQNTDYRL